MFESKLRFTEIGFWMIIGQIDVYLRSSPVEIQIFENTL